MKQAATKYLLTPWKQKPPITSKFPLKFISVRDRPCKTVSSPLSVVKFDQIYNCLVKTSTSGSEEVTPAGGLRVRWADFLLDNNISAWGLRSLTRCCVTGHTSFVSPPWRRWGDLNSSCTKHSQRCGVGVGEVNHIWGVGIHAKGSQECICWRR